MITSPHWDLRYLELARLIASWSKDPSTGVGACLVDPDHRLVSLGYNGLPRGIDDHPERLHHRDTKLALTLHAEQNALLFAQRPVTGCTCYTWPLPPCSACSALLIQAGIGRIVSVTPAPAIAYRWGQSLAQGAAILDEARIPRDLYRHDLLDRHCDD